MRKFALLLLLPGCVVFAQPAEQPRHMFHQSEPLTAASSLPPRAVAEGFLKSIAPQYGLSADDLAGAYVAKEYASPHNGVTHLVYRQQFQGIEVYNAVWTVNVDRDGRVINAGGALFQGPGAGVLPPEAVTAQDAVRAAVMAVNPKLGERYLPFQAEPAAAKGVRFHRGALAEDVEARAVWYGVNGTLQPAWLFSITDEDGIRSYETIVDSASRRVLANHGMTAFQNAPRGMVFERESPYPNPVPGTRVTVRPPLAARTSQPFTGAAPASPRGWVTANETSGNNTVVGQNAAGVRFLSTPVTAVSAARDFSFPLELGAGAPHPIQFSDAASVNLFYWINRVHDLFYASGFDEPAGNFQADNLQRGGVGGDAMLAYSHFGARAPAAAQLNNAFFSTRRREDGSPSMIAMFLGTAEGLFTDGSYDAQVIVHEYTHGVTTRLVQDLYTGFQGAAMGEAWSDIFALEYTLPEGAPVDGVYPAAEYLFGVYGTGLRTQPYSTSIEVNPLTFGHLGRTMFFPEIHADGEIWVEAMWEVRAALVRQFGEREGRRRFQLLSIDSMKLSIPAPTFVDARDAVLLADRVTFSGASQAQLWEAFARRGLGVLAQSSSNLTIHVLPSFERPSTVGAMKFYEDQYVSGEVVRIVLHDANNTQATQLIQLVSNAGDIENLVLRRRGSVFLGSLPTTSGAVTRQDGALALSTADFIAAYYVDANAEGSARLIIASVPSKPTYTLVLAGPSFTFPGETALNFRAPNGAFMRYNLPFEFPYFGGRHSTLRIYSNGLLAFDLGAGTSCTNTGALAAINGIAPLWMELRTNGVVQQREDVFVSRPSADAITFRWAAETDAVALLQQPEPVNFAVTLFRDGRIQFHYGSGNKNLANGVRFAGCPTATPTVGISNGHETQAFTSPIHSGIGTLENAASIIWEPPFGHSTIPVGQLESPAEGERVQGVISGRGIVYDAEAFLTRADIFIDGIYRARATLNAPRPDFCAQQNVRGCPNVGFTFALEAAALGLAPGRHTLALRATNSRGAAFDFPAKPITFELQPGQAQLPFGRIEAPAEGAEIAGTIQVRGYAAANELRVNAVDVLVDGVTYGRATYNLRRDDICGGLSPVPLNCPNVGFTFNLNTRGQIPLSNGAHRMQVRVQDQSGRFTLLPETPLSITVNNAPNQLPTGVATTPQNNERLRGVVRVSGHAYDPDGRIASVILYIDSEARFLVPYGRPRPEACATLPSVTACPNIGFEMDLDSRLMSNGSHVLGFLLVDDRGGNVLIPANISRDGMNVIVDNP